MPDCPPDTTQTYILYGGDSIVRTTDSVRVTGKLHLRAQVLDYHLPTTTITKTERITIAKEIGKHRLYGTVNTSLVPGIMYTGPYFAAGYQYDIRTGGHIGTLGMLLFSRPRKK
jgi:hypothetical protein